MTRLKWFGLVALSLLATGAVSAADWIHWRGPDQTGFSRETNLPDEWDPATPGRGNLVWKQPYGCRSTPLALNGKVYITGALNDKPGVPGPAQKLIIGEQVVCFDAATGKVDWEKHFNVFHTDIVVNRLGWAPLAADPENKLIFCHLTGGQLVALKADSGELVWEHSLTEEYGRATGYGGRLGGGPIYDSGLVIVGIVNSSWGNFAPGSNRFVAFDSKTGHVAWWAESTSSLKLTYSSNPMVAVIKGQRLLITGGADGSGYAFQVRTGKRAWSIPLSLGPINPSPVVDGDYVYFTHGEENPDGGPLGRVICVDGGNVINGKPKVVWDYRTGVRFGLSSPAIAEGKLYVADDSAKLYCFDAKKGKVLWKYNYGTVARGAPLVADGKIYISETTAKFHIIKLNGDEEPSDASTHTVQFRNKPGATGFVEVNSTPSVADGRVYLSTRDETYCIANKDAKPFKDEHKEPKEAAPGAVAQIQIVPADVVARPGETVTFTLKTFDANGVPVKAELAGVAWSLPVPKAPAPKGPAKGEAKKDGEEPKKEPEPKKEAPPAKTPAGPPPLDGTIEDGKLTLGKKPSQHGLIEARSGTMVATARVRVAPGIPYKQDFENVPVNAVPGGWVNAQGKYWVVEHEEADGKKSKVLFKKNDNPRPPLARTTAYLTMPESTNYTIEADVKGVMVRDKLPDAGLTASRYTFYLDSKPDAKGQFGVRLVSWEALPRINVETPLNWKSNVWYRLKMTVDYSGKEGIVKCKAWERGKPEPEKWTIEFKDPMPSRNGSGGLYGYIQNAEEGNPGSEIYFDNVAITPNTKK